MTMKNTAVPSKTLLRQFDVCDAGPTVKQNTCTCRMPWGNCFNNAWLSRLIIHCLNVGHIFDQLWETSSVTLHAVNSIYCQVKPKSSCRYCLLALWNSILPCKAKRQYLLTLQVSRYCLLALQSSIHRMIEYVAVFLMNSK